MRGPMSNTRITGPSLKIGYLMQHEAGDLLQPTAWALHIRAVVNGLERHGHQVRVVVLRGGRPQYTDDFEHWQVAPVPVSRSKAFRSLESTLRGLQSRLHLPYLNLFESYKFADAAASALAGCDILYERYWLLGYGGLMAARRMRVPLVLEVNGDLVEEVAQQGMPLSPGQWVGIRFMNRWLFRGTDHVVAVGETIMNRTVGRWGFDPAKGSVVTNGVDITMFDRKTNSDDLRLRYQLDGVPVVVFVGSFLPWHGVDLLVEAFSEVLGRGVKAKLILVGDGPTRPETENRVRSLRLDGTVVFTGLIAREIVAGLLLIADVAVICPPSSSAEIVETPLKLFEYMAAGKAIVAPAVPNMKRVLADRTNALLVPPDNPKTIADAIVELLGNDGLRQALGEAARHQAIERHSWDRAVSQLEAIMLEQVAGR